MKTAGIQLTILLLGVINISLYAQPDTTEVRWSFNSEYTPLAYEGIRGADIFWGKRVCRVIDVREKINLPFAYPGEPLVQILMNAAASGEITAFKDGAYGQLGDTLLPRELKEKMVSVDTIRFIHPVTEAETTMVYTTPIDLKKFTKYRLLEDYIFNKKTSTMEVRIRAIAPVEDVMDEQTGLKRGERLAFWLVYDDIRPVLAKHFAFNPHNFQVRKSWADVLDMRYFNSYIIWEDNVYAREIESYAPGIDAVLESERIKKELVEFEHNLWSY